MNLKAQLRYLRLKPFDTSQPDGRAEERHRRVALSALVSVTAKVINLFVIFCTVPLTLHYLGKERYGMWMVMSSTVALMSMADLGLGNGLLNFMARAKGLEDRPGMHRTVSSAFFMLLGMAGSIALALVVAWPFVDFGALFNVESPIARLEAGPAMAALVTCFLVGLPLTVSNQIQQGHQEGWKTSLWSMAGSLLSLGLVFLAVAAKASLAMLVFAVAGAPVLAQLGNTLYLFGIDQKWLAPEWRVAHFGEAKALLNLGLLFAIVQLSAVVAYTLDNLVITRILGPSAVPCYGLTQRIFSLTPMVMSFLLVPLRPAYSEALARGDSDWVIGTFKRSVRLATLLNVPAALALFFVAPLILRLWVGEGLVPPFSLLLASALWLVLQSLDAPLSVFLNGIGWMRIAAVMAPLMAGVNLGLSIIFTRRIGVAGPVFGTLASLLLVVYLPMVFILPRLLKSLAKGETPFLS